MPKRSDITELSFNTQVLFNARSCGRRSRMYRADRRTVRLGLVRGAEVVLARLVGPVIQVEAGQRHLVGELVLHLARISRLEVVVDERRPVVVGRAVVDVGVGQRQVLEHRRRNRVDAVGGDDVAGKRQLGQRIVNHDLLAARRLRPEKSPVRSAAVGMRAALLRVWTSWYPRSRTRRRCGPSRSARRSRRRPGSTGCSALALAAAVLVCLAAATSLAIWLK